MCSMQDSCIVSDVSCVICFSNVQKNIFLSMRFTSGSSKNEPLPLGIKIRKLLEAAGVNVMPAENPGLGDRAAEIADCIDTCDIFVVFATSDYGVDTGNPMCSYKEFMFAMQLKKKIAHIKMCEELGRGDKQAAVQMGLVGRIYQHENQGADALVAWILSEI